MARSKSSGKWLTEHFNDPYVKQSQQDGYRARAAYKLIEIDEKYHLIKNGLNIVDLGAAPGSWTQVIIDKAPQATVVGLDILPVEPLQGVTFIQGDFTENEVLDNLLAHLKNQSVDLIVSDMAPNMSGHKEVDIPRAMYLVELAQDFANITLKQGGSLLMKVFQGEGFDALLKSLRTEYKRVISYKPQSSRARSKELYLLCKDKREQSTYNR